MIKFFVVMFFFAEVGAQLQKAASEDKGEHAVIALLVAMFGVACYWGLA